MMSSDELYEMMDDYNSYDTYDSYDSYDTYNTYNTYNSYNSNSSNSSNNSYNSYDTYETVGTTSSNSISYSVPASVKFQSMFWVFAGALLIMLLGLRCIEKGNKISRILALIGLGFGVVGLILELALIWELFPLAETAGFYSYNMTVMGKLTVLVMATMIVAIGSALIMRIKESDKLVRILKWVAIGCGCGLWVITVIIIFANDLGNVLSKILGVSGVLTACFMVCWITALIMSRFNRKEEDSKPEVEVKKEVEVENVIVEPVKNEPIQAESTQVELAQVESVKIEPVQVEPVQAEPVQAELDPLQSFQNEGSEPSAAPHDTNV